MKLRGIEGIEVEVSGPPFDTARPRRRRWLLASYVAVLVTALCALVPGVVWYFKDTKAMSPANATWMLAQQDAPDRAVRGAIVLLLRDSIEHINALAERARQGNEHARGALQQIEIAAREAQR